MSDSKNESAWAQLFEKYNIDGAISRDGQYIISSKGGFYQFHFLFLA